MGVAEFSPIGSLFKTSSGGTPLKARREYYFGGDIPWLMSGEVAQGEITAATNFITEAGLQNSSAKIFPKNSVLVAMYGATAGEVGILRIEAATNQAVCGIFPNEQFIPEYLYYLLLSKKDELVGKAAGNAQPNISQAKIRETLVPIAEKAEQCRIVAILDEAFEDIATAKANAKKNLQNARELFESFMQSLFSEHGSGWQEKALEDVCEVSSTLVDPRDSKYLDLHHIGAGNIESRTGVLANIKTAREEQLISGKFLFDDSVVLYSKIRPYLMKVARPNFSGLCSADIYPLVSKSGSIDRSYLYHLLLTPAFTEYAIKGSARAGMPKVNREHLFAYRAWMPPVREQAQLAARLDALFDETQRLAGVCEAKLMFLDDLKKSLLHQAFTGQL